MSKQAACRWFGISRQAHYQQQRRQEVQRMLEGLIISRVLEIRQEQPRIGVRKLHHILMKETLPGSDLRIGRDRLFALMRRYGLLVKSRRKPTRTTFSGGVRCQNLLATALINGPNQAVVADITYIAYEQSYLYLALVTELYSRQIIGWDLSDSLSLEGAWRAMRQAIGYIRSVGGETQDMIHHSDHGVQYTSREYQALLHQAGVRPSMGAVGNAYDNAVAERVNGILKLEFLLDQRFPDALSARRAVSQAIHIYNTKRPHLALNYATPTDVYRQAMNQLASTANAKPFPIHQDASRPPLSQRKAVGFGMAP
ncbi:MAG: IS3 family transposase [Chloroflexi bacterium]|nr:IS3 family transposase [Chloroflexota bacterium]